LLCHYAVLGLVAGLCSAINYCAIGQQAYFGAYINAFDVVVGIVITAVNVITAGVGVAAIVISIPF